MLAPRSYLAFDLSVVLAAAGNAAAWLGSANAGAIAGAITLISGAAIAGTVAGITHISRARLNARRELEAVLKDSLLEKVARLEAEKADSAEDLADLRRELAETREDREVVRQELAETREERRQLREQVARLGADLASFKRLEADRHAAVEHKADAAQAKSDSVELAVADVKQQLKDRGVIDGTGDDLPVLSGDDLPRAGG